MQVLPKLSFKRSCSHESLRSRVRQRDSLEHAPKTKDVSFIILLRLYYIKLSLRFVTYFDFYAQSETFAVSYACTKSTSPIQ
jgi:hypothetical protein